MKKFYPHLQHLLKLFLILALVNLVARPFFGAAALAQEAPPGPIIITEILANALDDNKGEVIEILNDSAADVDLAGWQFLDGSGNYHLLVPFPADLSIGTSRTLLAPGQIGLILDKDYDGSYDSEILAVEAEASLLTAGSGNLFLANSSDSVSLLDETGQVSDSFSWSQDSGNGISFARTQIDGIFGELAPDLAGTSLGWLRVETSEPPTEEPPNQPSNEPPLVRISEAWPNPPGDDSAEFIEIENYGNAVADLVGLEISDTSGKTFALTGMLEAGDYLVLEKAQTGIQLNNTSDGLTLYWGQEVIDATDYVDAAEGLSWSRFGESFEWTTSATPGQPNELISDEEDATEEANDEETQDYHQLQNLADLNDYQEGQLVEFTGVVATKVGLFYKKSFHVVDQSGGILATLASEEAEGSSIKPGQLIKARGELGSLSKMPRISLDATLEVVQDTADIPSVDKKVSAIDDEDVGRLVQVQGTVASRSNKSFRLADDQEILVSVRKNTEITAKAPAKNSSVKVAGIVLRSGEQLVLAPRASTDIRSGSGELLAAGGNQAPIIFWAAVFSVWAVYVRRRVLARDRLRNYSDYDVQ